MARLPLPNIFVKMPSCHAWRYKVEVFCLVLTAVREALSQLSCGEAMGLTAGQHLVLLSHLVDELVDTETLRKILGAR